MKILLLNPCRDAYVILPHLGLGYLAAALKKHGHEVRVMDGLREKISLSSDYDLVGITTFNTSYAECLYWVKEVKSRGMKCILGGVTASTIPEKILRDSGADYAMIGEGEIALPLLADGIPKEDCPGLIWLDKENIDGSVRVEYGKPNTFHPCIDDFGQPDWDAIDPRTYPYAPHGMIAKAYPIAPVITSRGCPYDCAFCTGSVLSGKKIRLRNPKKVVDEIELLITKYAVKEIQIEDDNFTFHRSHAEAICKEIIARKLKLHWCLPNGIRADKVDAELLALMRQSGCYLTALGIESASPRILKMIGKKLDISHIREYVQMVANSGIEITGFFMIGFPTETKEEINKTIQLALSLPLNRAAFTLASPYTGTRLYREWLQSQNIDEGSLDLNKINHSDFDAGWASVDYHELKRLQKYALRRFYARPQQLWGMLKNFKIRQISSVIKRFTKILRFSKI